MRAGPSKSAYRSGLQTTFRRLWSKARVVSAEGKGPARPGQVSGKKRTVSKSPDAVQDDSMRWDNNIDGPACLLHLACPQVVCGIAAFILGEAHGRRLYGDFFRLPAGVEQTDDRVSVRFHLGEHLVVAGIDNPFRSD